MKPPMPQSGQVTNRQVINPVRRLTALVSSLLISCIASAQLTTLDVDDPAAAVLLNQLRDGGYILAVRHADTGGMPCDRTYRIGEREGQRNISELGREQSRRLGESIRELGIPIHEPVLTGPVFRARDTAELAFGVDYVEITESLLADDYAGRRVRWVISEHRRLLNEPVEPGANQILVGHRTPILAGLNGRVSRLLFPEGAAIILQPGDEEAEVIGIINFAPIPNPGIDRC